MKNQKGFSLVLAIVLIACLGVIGFAGWKVSNQKDSGQKNPDSTKQEEQKSDDTQSQSEPNLSESWLLRESAEASIRVPDGFKILASQNQLFNFTLPDDPQGTLKYSKGEPAVVVGEPAKHFGLGLIVGFNNEGLNDRGMQVREFKAYSGLNVTVKLFEQTVEPDGVDYPKGAKHLKYTVGSSNKYINVDYVYLGDGLVNIIDEMVKSANIK